MLLKGRPSGDGAGKASRKRRHLGWLLGDECGFDVAWTFLKTVLLCLQNFSDSVMCLVSKYQITPQKILVDKLIAFAHTRFYVYVQLILNT